MIVKNEEDVIGRCLKSVAELVDEIIVVDTGSTDNTKKIVSEFTNAIYDFEWIDDFGAARNYAFSKASCPYSMWLDADDIFLPIDREIFLKLKSELDTSINAVLMKYNTGFDENGNITFSYFRERIIKNNIGMQWVGAVHEVIPTIGKTQYSECAVTHQKLHPSDPDRNLQIFEKQIESGAKLDLRQQYYYGRELYYHKRFNDAINVFESFLVDNSGWLENKIDACIHCAYCYYGLGKDIEALEMLFKSFVYDIPRAEVCCNIGKHFFDRATYNQAIYWYERAYTCDLTENQSGFIAADSYGYTPCIQLCVCYSRLGNYNKAIEYNSKAAKYKPNSEAVAHNRIYFSSLGSPK